MPCEIFVQLRDSLVVIEATQGADFVVDVLRKDGYDARQVGSDLVVVKDRLGVATAQVAT